MYWPRHQVFFVATAALFPELLKGKLITLHFYRPYFASDNERAIEVTMEEYRKLGYIEYEPKGDCTYLITDVHVHKAVDDLRDYLDKWQRDRLKLLSAQKPATHNKQQELLYKALAKCYSIEPGERQRITLEDIYGSPNSDIFGAPFWELVLSTQESDKPVAVIENIAYDRSMSGLYADDAQPFVDLKITDQQLLRSLELASRASEPLTDEDPEEYTYNGLRACRDGSVTYNGVRIGFTPQQADVMRVFLRRPEELRTFDDFIDPQANVFSGSKTEAAKLKALRKLIPATRKTLEAAINQQGCISNTPNQGWTLTVKPRE